MTAASRGHTDMAIALLKAKADINAKNKVRVGLAGWMVVCVCVQRLMKAKANHKNDVRVR